MIACKQGKAYPIVMGWLGCRLSFATTTIDVISGLKGQKKVLLKQYLSTFRCMQRAQLVL